MHPPPDLEILNKLKNSALFTISFGLYVVHFSFENEDILSFSCPFRFSKTEDIFNQSVCEFPILSTSLIRVIGQSIIDINCEQDGTLSIIFEECDNLILYANDPMYEAYTMKIADKEYIV